MDGGDYKQLLEEQKEFSLFPIIIIKEIQNMIIFFSMRRNSEKHMMDIKKKNNYIIIDADVFIQLY